MLALVVPSSSWQGYSKRIDRVRRRKQTHHGSIGKPPASNAGRTLSPSAPIPCVRIVSAFRTGRSAFFFVTERAPLALVALMKDGAPLPPPVLARRRSRAAVGVAAGVAEAGRRDAELPRRPAAPLSPPPFFLDDRSWICSAGAEGDSNSGDSLLASAAAASGTARVGVVVASLGPGAVLAG